MNHCELKMAERMATTRIKTLVVDDSPLMLKILVQILEQAGDFDLLGTASDGCQGLRYVSLLSPELVLMDAHMPRLSGVQATRIIKQREYPPKVVIVTSDDSTVTKTMAEEAGADGLVIKDGNLRHRLITALQDLFGPSAARREKRGIDVTVNRASPYKISEKCRESRSTAPEERTARCRTSFLEAHSACKRDACLGSTTLLSVPTTGRSPATVNRSCSCALPHEFSPPERRTLNHTHHENTETAK